MMKKLMVFTLVLIMASAANAGLLLSWEGIVDPPDTEVYMEVSEYACIDVYSNGGNPPSMSALLIIQGPGSLDASNAWAWQPGGLGKAVHILPPALSSYIYYLDYYGYAGVTDIIDIVIIPTATDPIPIGTVIDNIIMHCDAEGDVTLTLLEAAEGFALIDQMVIHQIPEPMTIALLSLGALFLRRRK